MACQEESNSFSFLLSCDVSSHRKFSMVVLGTRILVHVRPKTDKIVAGTSEYMYVLTKFS